MVGNATNETDFPHKLLLTNTQISRLRKGIADDSSSNIKFSKTQLSKMGQSGECLTALFIGC